jgi:hypothetical protein
MNVIDDREILLENQGPIDKLLDRRLRLFMREIGIRYVGVNKYSYYARNHRNIYGKKRYAWDGKKLVVYDMPIYHIAHEIGHWIECPVKYRKFPEYGLGTGVDSFSKEIDPLVSFKIANRREVVAAFIGCGIMHGLLEDTLENNIYMKMVCEEVTMRLDELGSKRIWTRAVNNKDIIWMRKYSVRKIRESHLLH